MSKVKLTQKQARMFENHKDAVKELLEKRVCDNCPTSIDSLPIDDVVKAIVYGYEVEPEFKVGDFVVWHGSIVNIKHPQTNDYKDDGSCYFTLERSDGSTYGNISRDEIRHATPEEIAEEKERRWWRARNRDVWELRAQDILKQKSGNELAEVKKVHNSGYLIGKWTCYESKEYVKKHYTVVCLAENRLDVKDDE